MTGTQYIFLHEGDQCILLEDIGEWHKGNIIEMVYRDSHEDRVYFKNVHTTINGIPSYGTLQVKTCLRALSLYKKFGEEPVTKTIFEHKFNVGDTIWRMYNNKPEACVIDRIEYTEFKDTKVWNYYCICDGDSVFDDNCEIYSSKDELLDSLR